MKQDGIRCLQVLGQAVEDGSFGCDLNMRRLRPRSLRQSGRPRLRSLHVHFGMLRAKTSWRYLSCPSAVREIAYTPPAVLLTRLLNFELPAEKRARLSLDGYFRLCCGACDESNP